MFVTTLSESDLREIITSSIDIDIDSAVFFGEDFISVFYYRYFKCCSSKIKEEYILTIEQLNNLLLAEFKKDYDEDVILSSITFQYSKDEIIGEFVLKISRNFK